VKELQIEGSGIVLRQAQQERRIYQFFLKAVPEYMREMALPTPAGTLSLIISGFPLYGYAA